MQWVAIIPSKPVVSGRPRKIVLVAGLVLAWMATLALVAGALWWSTLDRGEASDRVEHTHAVLLTAERVLTAADDAETGQRGYLLTLDPLYLEPYRLGAARTEERVGELRGLIADNPVQTKRLAEMETFVGENSPNSPRPWRGRALATRPAPWRWCALAPAGAPWKAYGEASPPSSPRTNGS